jgi:predicted phage replisome organizer
MASDVKWIRMMVGMFDGMSFKKIKRAKIGGESFRDKLTAIWFELMDFAGRCNHNGFFVSPSEIPFTDLADIATMIDRDEEELRLCMAFYIKEGMITITDDVYSLTNWSEYQNQEGLEKIREQTRKRVAKHREKQKLLACNVTCNDTVTQSNETDKEIELDIDKDINNIISESDDSAPAPPKKVKQKKEKPPKHKYGEFQHVLLTDNEYENLANSFGTELRDQAIKFLDEYIEDKGYKSQSHNMAIRRWVIDAVKEKQQKQTRQPARKEPTPKWMAKTQNRYDFDDIEKNLTANAPKPVADNPELAARMQALRERLQVNG